MNFSYPKKEKLCSHAIIERLFKEGNKIYEFPLRIIWIIEKLPDNVAVQTAVSVSKHRFKRAYKRNLLKRRMREAFRLNNAEFYRVLKAKNIQLAAMIIYNNNEILAYSIIEKAMIKALNKLSEKFNN